MISSSSAERTSASGRSTPHTGFPGASRRTSRIRPSADLLVALQRLPRPLAVDRHRPRVEHGLDHVRREPGETQRREEPERDRVAVADRVERRRLERVREGVAEVEDRAAAALVGIREADARLVGGAGADHLRLREIPDVDAREQPGLDHFGHACPALLLRKGRDQLRVDHDLLGIVERAGQVLALAEVDRGLAADPGVHLADERGRRRDPRHAPHVRGRDEAGEIGRRPAAVADDRPVPGDAKLGPEALRLLDRLLAHRVHLGQLERVELEGPGIREQHVPFGRALPPRSGRRARRGRRRRGRVRGRRPPPRTGRGGARRAAGTARDRSRAASPTGRPGPTQRRPRPRRAR